MNNIQKALITGATGFIGSNLSRRLVKEDWLVHVIARSESNLNALSDIKDRIIIHTYNGSISEIHDILCKSNPTIVFHLASLFIAEHKPGDIEEMIKSNILFGTQLIEAMVKTGVYRFVNTGTSWQHYNNEDYNPVNLYAATKQAFEDILKYYVEATTLKVITLKLYDTYGPNDQREKLFNLLKKAETEHTPLAMSAGEQLIDIVYIDDVIDAFLIAAKKLINEDVKSHERYAISSGNPIKLKELVNIYEKERGIKLPIQWGLRPYRKREVMVPWNNGVKLEGWSPKISLLEGIRKIIKIEGSLCKT